MSTERIFTPYQVFYIVLAAASQFLVVLDFMVLSPLSAKLLPELGITTAQFGMVVSAYAFSAGASGILAAGFSDRFDRKNLLLFFYGGFIIGTLFCGLAPGYWSLLVARVITGIFGGVVGSIGFAILTDLFEPQIRGRAMGFVQMAFSSAQILGLPVGLYLANHWDWHAPFLLIVGLAIPLWVVTFFKMQPVRGHLSLQKDHSAFDHLLATAMNPVYLRAFAATTLLATGGFMLMPFGAAYTVSNLGIAFTDLPKIYLVSGLTSVVTGPIVGRLTDKFGAIRLFWAGSLLSIALVLTYTNLGVSPLWLVMIINAVLFMGVTTRMISSQSLMSTVPKPADRGAFMGVNSSVAQISGGIASGIAGLIIHKTSTGYLEHYPTLGLVISGTMIVCGILMLRISNSLRQRAVV